MTLAWGLYLPELGNDENSLAHRNTHHTPAKSRILFKIIHLFSIIKSGTFKALRFGNDIHIEFEASLVSLAP